MFVRVTTSQSKTQKKISTDSTRLEITDNTSLEKQANFILVYCALLAVLEVVLGKNGKAWLVSFLKTSKTLSLTQPQLKCK